MASTVRHRPPDLSYSDKIPDCVLHLCLSHSARTRLLIVNCLSLSVPQCPDKFSFRSCKFQIRRCKESTGRVVMWRQMNIYNSFTLEATFSGTILDKCVLFSRFRSRDPP